MLCTRTVAMLSMMQASRLKTASMKSWCSSFWYLKSATLKNEMIYASTKSTIKKKPTDIKHEL